MEVQKGMRDKLSRYVDINQPIEVTLRISGKAVYDFCCFGVDADHKLSDDRYMIFYNQTASPNRAITYTPLGGAVFRIETRRIPEEVNKLVFTVSIDGEGTMGEIDYYEIFIGNIGGEALSAKFSGDKFSSEKAVITAEIYRKEEEWRFSIVGSGFNEGIGELLRYYGGADVFMQLRQGSMPFSEPPAAAVFKDPEQFSLEKKLEKAPELVPLAKPLIEQAEKKELTECRARTALVMDITGSMLRSYRDGAVQRIVDKMLPLAVKFDDDGKLDLWYYAKFCEKREPVTTDNYTKAVPDNWRELMAKLGGANDEPVVIRDVMDFYKDTDQPVYIIFITDGGVSKETEIEELITEASKMPLFWQFVGISGSNYGVLKKIDDLEGRYVNNADFFAVDNFGEVSDEELYEKLFNEFPDWLSEIKKLGML